MKLSNLLGCTRDDCKLCFGGAVENGGKSLNAAGYCTDFCSDIFNNSTLYCGTGPKYENHNSTFSALIDCTECKHDSDFTNMEQLKKGKYPEVRFYYKKIS